MKMTEDQPKQSPTKEQQQNIPLNRLKLKMLALRLLKLKNHGTPSQKIKAIAQMKQMGI